MTQLKRKLDGYFFGEELPNKVAAMYYGSYAAMAVVSVALFIAIY